MIDSQTAAVDGSERHSFPAAMEYEKRIRECRKLEKRYRRSALWTRLAASSMFVLFLVSLGFVFRGFVHPVATLFPLALCLVLVKWGDRLSKAKQKLSVASGFYGEGLNRIAGTWMGRGNTNSFVDDSHLYARDLDLFGNGSLFELLCTARTEVGAATLAEWLSTPAFPVEIVERQKAVKELQLKTDLREALAVLRPKIQKRSMGGLLTEWTRKPSPEEARVARWVAVILASLTFGAALMWLLFQYRTAPLLGVALAGQVGFSLWYYNRRHAVLDFADELHEEFRTLRSTFARIEEEKFSCPKLCGLQAELHSAKQSASLHLAALIKRIEYLQIARAAWPITGFLLLATQLSFIVEQWQRSNRVVFQRWITALGELEALCSLAAFAFEHPKTTFPEIIPGPGLFEARDVRHPLLLTEQCVPNSLDLGTNVRLLIVSGSNMSGKSTLLRTVGTNVVLAQAGSSVCAAQMRLSRLAIGGSIRIQDSLRHGTSRFYAEITKLKATVDLTEDTSCPVLFLIDEMLSGTNYYDRSVGAEAVLRCLMDSGAIGVVTTHDLTLTKLANSPELFAANVHFQDELDNDRITFDHVFHPGIVQRSNALELMRAIGLKIPSRDIQSPSTLLH